MPLEEVKELGGNHIIPVGIDPTTGKMYPMAIDPSTGSLISGPTSSSESLQSILKRQDFVSYLSSIGKTFSASAAAPNTTITGQTSYVNTTPTFLLNVPSGITAIPLFMGLAQTGTVAGADINVLMGKDKINRYSSGGTEASYMVDRSSIVRAPSCKLYTNPTAVAGAALRMLGQQIAADVSPAEGVINEVVWTPAGRLEFLDGPAAWLVFTFAGTTGPTWFWEFGWAELLTSDLPTS